MTTTSKNAVVRHLCRLMAVPAAEEATDGQLLERFASQHEEAAFGALLRRHGPMVLNVCRRVLRHAHDAEDAFQATFLLLASKASSILKHESVGSWLHGVAFRLAVRAKAQRSRRQTRSRPVTDLRTTDPSLEAAWRELQALLDEVLRQLPEKYRAPLVLCYLEGYSHEQAARQLGWPVGTVSGRLARGRDLLRTRLARRGLTLSAAALATALAVNTAAATLPATLLKPTLQAAVQVGAAGAVGGVSEPVALLLAGGLRGLLLGKLKTLAALVLVACVLTVGAGLLGLRAVAGKPADGQPAAAAAPADPRREATPAQPAKASAEGQFVVAGRVLAADGNPVPAADVAVLAWSHELHREGHNLPRPEVWGQARTEADGRFRLAIARPQSLRNYLMRLSQIAVVAGGTGQGLGWHFLNFKDSRFEAVLRLRPEQVLRGRLIDLQGQPAAGVEVSVLRVGRRAPSYQGFGGPDGDEFIEATAGVVPGPNPGPIRLWEEEILLHELPGPLAAWPGPVTTDAAGSFVLRGIGRNQAVGLRVRGNERVAFQALQFEPRPEAEPPPITFSVAGPRLIAGVVTDAATGRPLPRALVHIDNMDRAGFLGRWPVPADWKGRRGLMAQGFAPNSTPFSEYPAVEGRTDDQGRFLLSPFHGREFTVIVRGPEGQPYLGVKKTVRWPKAVARQHLAVELPGGVYVQGQVGEASSGKPVARARVDVWSKEFRPPSTMFVQVPEGVLYPEPCKTDSEGRFQLTLPAGPCHLLINGPAEEFVHKKIASAGLGVEQPDELGAGLPSGKKPGVPHYYYPDDWIALDHPAGARPPPLTVTLRRAPLLKGQVVGPDGKPVARLKMFHGQEPFAELTHGYFAEQRPLKEGRFEVPFRNLEAPLCLIFMDEENGRGAAVALSSRQAGGEPVTVRLAPCGTAAARFVDGQGKPLANYRPLLWLSLPAEPYASAKALEGQLNRIDGNYDALWAGHLDARHYGSGPRTDAQGRVSLPALVPGATYRLCRFDGTTLDFKAEAGKTVVLPDIVVKEPGKTAGLPRSKSSQ